MSGHVLRTVGEQGLVAVTPRHVVVGVDTAAAGATGPLPIRSAHVPHLDLQVNLRRAGELLCEVGQILQDIQLDAVPERALMEPVKSAPFLTAADIAKRLQVDAKTVRRWREAGQLPPALEVGGIIRWRAEDIDAWLQEQLR